MTNKQYEGYNLVILRRHIVEKNLDPVSFDHQPKRWVGEERAL
jgi:hypothetical protein